jgi:hypothetical protein
MSGPKRATWSFTYDPTSRRIQDLEFYAATQEDWLQRHGEFIRRYLGEEAWTAALNALGAVDECITAQDPDSGFDAYGDAWNLLNELHTQAREAKRQHQEAKREARRRQRQAAQTLIAECQAIWDDHDNQDLLHRWTGPTTVEGLRNSLCALTGGDPTTIQQRARQWRRRWDTAVAKAEKIAAINDIAFRDCLPKFRAALEDIQRLNTQILSDGESFELDRKRLQQEADLAIREKDVATLTACAKGLRALHEAQLGKIKAAEFKKATDKVRAALAACGYSVESREDKDGAVVLRASAFPMKLVNVQMAPARDEMRLDVKDQHGTHCVQDIRSLQAELARHGMELAITDWGKGSPQSARCCVEQNAHAGRDS